MAAPVWVLSVDLQTKTATFQTGMAEAAKTARGAFTEIKSGSEEMSGHVGSNMFASRHAIMAVSEAFGDTMPRAITALLVHLGPVGAALEAAFPYAAIGLAAVLVVEHFAKMREESEKLVLSQSKLGTTVQTTFNSLDEKMLQAEIRADELRNDHLGALHHQIELINKQSLGELVREFGVVAKAADEVFKGLQSHWYTQGIGAAGAQHALEEFQSKYESLLAQGKDKEASDLLRGTRESAEKVLAMQKQAKDTESYHAEGQGGNANAYADQVKNIAAMNTLRAAGVGYTEKEVQAQQALVEALQAQSGVEEKVTSLRKQDAANATTSTGNEAAAMKAAGARAHAQAMLQINESALAADKAAAETSLTIQRASIAERLANDISFADRDFQLKMSANQAETAALDKASKDYTNQLKAMQDKSLEITQQHETAVSELRSRAALEQAQKESRDREQSLREGIDATEKASSARLAAIDAAIKTEQGLNLQDTSFYRELLTQRVQTVREAADEEAKLRAEAGKEASEHEQRMGEIAIAAEREAGQSVLAQALLNERQKLQLQGALEAEEYQNQRSGLERDLAAINEHDKDVVNKKQALNNKLAELDQEYKNKQQQLDQQMQQQGLVHLTSAQSQMVNAYLQGFTQVLMGKESFAKMAQQVDSQIASAALQNALMSIAQLNFGKEEQAAKAARTAFVWGWENGGPAAPILAPTLAAGAFAAAMAYQDGTDMVPGVTRGDTVPAMLTPGEGVVPGGVMDGLRNMARNGSLSGGGTHYHVQAHYAPQVNAIDGAGVGKMLIKHGKEFQRHMEQTLRRMNR